MSKAAVRSKRTRTVELPESTVKSRSLKTLKQIKNHYELIRAKMTIVIPRVEQRLLRAEKLVKH